MGNSSSGTTNDETNGVYRGGAYENPSVVQGMDSMQPAQASSSRGPAPVQPAEASSSQETATVGISLSDPLKKKKVMMVTWANNHTYLLRNAGRGTILGGGTIDDNLELVIRELQNNVDHDFNTRISDLVGLVDVYKNAKKAEKLNKILVAREDKLDQKEKSVRDSVNLLELVRALLVNHVDIGVLLFGELSKDSFNINKNKVNNLSNEFYNNATVAGRELDKVVGKNFYQNALEEYTQMTIDYASALQEQQTARAKDLGKQIDETFESFAETVYEDFKDLLKKMI